MNEAPSPTGLPRSYEAGRREFLATAEQVGARMETTPHPAAGVRGEALAIDVAYFGPENARDAVLIVSGTHGVEGFAGSALQSHWLRHCADDAPEDIRTIWLHALNPVGFSWTRRVNEDNVDLNRNFIDWNGPRPANDGYDAMAAWLVPESWSEQSQRESTGALLEHAAKIGMEGMQADVSQGQYAHPTGIFYGGSGPTWSHEQLHALCGRELARHARLGIIDLHTGLGPWGHGELILCQPTADPAYARAAAWWGEVHSMLDDGSVSAALTGDWLARIPKWLPDTEVTSAGLEYGTVDPIAVLQSLRADAWLHAHGDPRAAQAETVRAAVRAAFADDDPAWIAKLWPRFEEVLRGAFDGLRPSR